MSTEPAPRFDSQLLRQLSGSTEPAVVGPAMTWSAQELLAAAGGAARLFDQWGAGPEPLPALVSSSPMAYALLVAGALTGRPLAPLNPRAPVAELREVLASCGSTQLVVEPGASELGQRLAQAMPGLAVRVVGEVPMTDYDFGAAADGPLALVLHTSGTTGSPRAVRVTQERFAARVPVVTNLFDLGEGDSVCSGAPLHHVAGVAQGLVALAVGAAVVTLPWFSVDGWKWVRTARPTHVTLVPTMLQMLLAERLLDSGMRRLQYGAAPVQPGTVRQVLAALPGTEICQLYGQTEATPLTFLSHSDHLEALAGRESLLSSVGRPVQGVELRIDGAGDDGIGEIVVRAPHLFTAAPGEEVRTGDLGRLDADGFLYLAGRRGDMIIRGGENIYPEQVEAVLTRHPAVDQVAVVGRPDDRLGEVPVAYVVPSHGAAAVDENALRAWARDQLSAYKIPVAWHVRQALPINAAGKLIRHRLADGPDA